MTRVRAPRILHDGVLRGPGAVVVEGGRIVEVVTPAPSPHPDDITLPHGILTPGLVDLQVNGAFGMDLADATPADWLEIRRRLPSTGVTAFCPTLITAPIDLLAAGVDRVGAARAAVAPSPSARVLGAHLEGPWLSGSRPGAHQVALFVDPTREALDELLTAGRAEHLAIVTLAPERPGALDAVQRLAGAGVVVSVGHSDASAAQTRAAADAGARMVTHLFNAQRGIDRREPGVAGAALVDPRYRLGLIVDGHHLAPEVVRLTFAAAAGRVVLVTDATAAAGVPAGRYRLGGQDAYVHPDERVPRREDGTIAGSALTLDEAVRLVAGLGIDPGVALDAATRVPADAIGAGDLGRLDAGAVADLVWWSDDLQVLRTWVGGEVAWAG